MKPDISSLPASQPVKPDISSQPASQPAVQLPPSVLKPSVIEEPAMEVSEAHHANVHTLVCPCCWSSLQEQVRIVYLT